MTAPIVSPSRQFLVMQACLNAALVELESGVTYLVKPWLEGRFRAALASPDLDWECLTIIPIIRAEFRALANRYGAP